MLPEKDRIGSDSLRAKQYCDKLFAIEKELKDCTPEERYKKRHNLAKPILEAFLSYLHSTNPASKTGFGKAAHYVLDQWKHLVRYLLDGRLEISNNRAERSVKPFVIDRKNFLFANTARGAKASAIIFSIIETAKENGLNPYAYLAYIFKKAPNYCDWPNDVEALQNLLPWFVPDSCKSNTTGLAGGLIKPCKGMILASATRALKNCQSQNISSGHPSGWLFYLLPFTGSPVNGSIYSLKLAYVYDLYTHLLQLFRFRFLYILF